MTTLHKYKTTKIPSGISSFDHYIEGGFPSGSLILLQGLIGAGNTEFAYTSTVMTADTIGNDNISKNETDMYGTSSNVNDIIYPKNVCYISMTKSRNDVISEISLLFPNKSCETLCDHITFIDLSPSYFDRTRVPMLWIQDDLEKDENATIDSKNPLDLTMNLSQDIMTCLDKYASDSIVIIDSFTDLVRYSLKEMDWDTVISFLIGLQKASKKWNGIVYLILTENIFENSQEVEIANCVDGVLKFKWEDIGPTMRQRKMYIEMFRKLMPQIESDNIANFETKIDVGTGFEVSKVTQVIGFITGI